MDGGSAVARALIAARGEIARANIQEIADTVISIPCLQTALSNSICSRSTGSSKPILAEATSMIFRRSGSQNKRDQVAGKAVSQAQIGAPKSLKDTHPANSDVQQTAVVPSGTRQDPLADDLIVRVLKAMEDWARRMAFPLFLGISYLNKPLVSSMRWIEAFRRIKQINGHDCSFLGERHSFWRAHCLLAHKGRPKRYNDTDGGNWLQENRTLSKIHTEGRATRERIRLATSDIRQWRA